MANTPTFLFGDIEAGGLNGLQENGQLGQECYPIIEVAFILTDADLNEIDTFHQIAHIAVGDIERMDSYARAMHEKTGLLEKALAASVWIFDIDNAVISWLQSHNVQSYSKKAKTGVIFAGNSIMYDRDFMQLQMPKLNDYMHYRQMDVSALALAARHWCPEFEKQATQHKTYQHIALTDIRETIQEAKHYRQLFTQRAPAFISRGEVS